MLARWGSKVSFVVFALVAALVPVAAFAQTPVAPGDIITDATSAMTGVVSAGQITNIILAAVGISLGLWMARRGLKLGR